MRLTEKRRIAQGWIEYADFARWEFTFMYLEAAYRVIERSPKLRREWFGAA